MDKFRAKLPNTFSVAQAEQLAEALIRWNEEGTGRMTTGDDSGLEDLTTGGDFQKAAMEWKRLHSAVTSVVGQI